MAEQIQQLEAELTKEWQDKCDRLVAAANEKHQRELRELNEEKVLIEQKVNAMEKKIASQKASSAAGEKKTSELQEQVDELKVWKDKYENIRAQATAMKERYESRISELADERDNALAKMQEAIKRSSVGGQGTVDKQQQVQEVKKIMNQVYHSLRAEFEADKSYKGTSIHSVVMQTIKDTTLKLVQEKEEEEESEEELEEEVIQPQSSSVQLAAKEDVIQVQKQSTTAAKPPSKAAAEKKKPEPKLEDFSIDLKAIEDSIIQIADTAEVIHATVAKVTGDKGNPFYAQELDNKKVDGYLHSIDKLEKTIAKIQGDKGNPHYAKELGDQVIKVQKQSSTSAPKPGKDAVCKKAAAKAADPKFKPLDPKEIEASIAKIAGDADIIQVKIAKITGDKGNPFYAQELDQAKMEPYFESIKEIKKTIAAIQGDKGNPHYAKELDDAIIVQKESSTSAAKPPGKDKPASKDAGTKKKDEPKLEDFSIDIKAIEASIMQIADQAETIHATVAKVTGDKGNLFYAQKLDQGKINKHLGTIKDIEKSIAKVQGDKGNRYYGKELEEAAIKVQKQSTTSAAKDVIVKKASEKAADPKFKPLDPKQIEDSIAKIAIDAETIHVKIAKITGDKGNPFYAQELDQDKMGPYLASIKDIEKSIAILQGDKGNPHYAKELEKDIIKVEKPSTVHAAAPPGKAAKDKSLEAQMEADLFASLSSIEDQIQLDFQPTSSAPLPSKSEPPIKSKDSKITKEPEFSIDEQIMPSVAQTSSAPAPSAKGAKDSQQTKTTKDPKHASEKQTPEVSVIKPSAPAPDTKDSKKESKATKDSLPTVPDAIMDFTAAEFGDELLNIESALKQVEPDKSKAASKATDKTPDAKQIKEKVEDISENIMQFEAAMMSDDQLFGAIEAPIKCAKAMVTGDRGNLAYGASIDSQAISEGVGVIKEKAHLLGDKGNPYYAAELEGKKLEDTKPKTEEVKKETEKKPEEKDKKSDEKDKKAEVKPSSDKKKESPTKKVDTKKPTKIEQKLETAISTKPPPLFDDDEDDDDDLFGTKSAKPTKKEEKKPAKKEDKKPAAPAATKMPPKRAHADSDDDLKPKPPPPLFDDDDDDEDLDWLK